MQDLASNDEPSAAGLVAALGSPNQPRDADGKWTDGHGGGRSVPAGDGGTSGSSGYTPGGSWRGRSGGKAKSPSAVDAGASDGRSVAQKKRHADQRDTADVAEKRARSHEAKAQKARDEAAKKRQELEDTRDSVEPKRRRAEELDEVYQRKLEAHNEAEQRFDEENFEDVAETRRNKLAEEADQARSEMRATKREAAEAAKAHGAAERRVSRLEDEYSEARETATSRHLAAETARNRANLEREHADLLEKPHAEYAAEASKRAASAKGDVSKASAAADAAERDLSAARKSEQDAIDTAIRGPHANAGERERAHERAKIAADARASAEERSMAADNAVSNARIRAKYWADATREARSLKPVDGDGDGKVREAERADQLSAGREANEDTMSTIETLAVGEDVPLELVNGQAPRELRLFRKGENPSTKGSFLFDDVAAKKVMSAYERMGRRWVIADYDHGSLQRNPVDPSRSARSAGKASLELRDGELWATGIQWTPAAKASIEAGEWPSVSPAFAHGEDRRPTWLMNFGLTGNPALHGPAELIAANVLRSIFDPTDPDEPEAAASTNTGAQPARTEAAAKVTEKLNMKTRTAAELAEFLGWSEGDASALLSMWGGRKKALSGSTVALSVGLGAEAEEPAVFERLHALAGTEREIFAELNAKDKAEALGAITGLKKAAETAERATAELAEVKGRQIRSEVDAILNAGKDAKKLTPAELADESENGLRATALSKGDKATTWLTAHIANRPVIAALSTSVKEPDEKTQTQGSHGADSAPDWMGEKKYADLSIAEKEKLAAEAPALFERLSAEHRKTIRSSNYTALHAR